MSRIAVLILVSGSILQMGGCPPIPMLRVDAGPDQNVVSGVAVVLSATITNPDGLETKVQWTQVGGPGVSLTASGANGDVQFIAPNVGLLTNLQFSVVVTDTQNPATFAVDTVVVNVDPTQTPVRAVWSNSTAQVNVDIDWRLPSGGDVVADRGNWGTSGVESISLESALIPDGMHWLTMRLDAPNAASTVAYNAKILDYTHVASERFQGGTLRRIALDILDGKALPIFNGWLTGDDAGSGGLTNRYPIEVLAAWRNATSDMQVELDVQRPNGSFLNSDRDGWARQGLERTAVPPGVTVDSGTHRIHWLLSGESATADVTFFAKLLDYAFEKRERLIGEKRRIIGVDVHQGIARPIFNGWLPAADMLAPLAPDRPLQVTAGFMSLTGDVRIEVHVQTPSGEFLPVNHGGWGRQDFESVGLDVGVPLTDGEYKFTFLLIGAGETADVAYKAKLLNWSFERNERLIGELTRTIDVRIQGGVAMQIGSNW